MLLVKIDFQKSDLFLAHTEENFWSYVDYTAIKALSCQKHLLLCLWVVENCGLLPED